MFNLNKLLSIVAVGSSLAAVILFSLVTSQCKDISQLKSQNTELNQQLTQKDQEIAIRIRQHEEDLETSKRQEELLSNLEKSKDIDNLNHIPDGSILDSLRRD